jgi:hypothetical protein
MNPRLGEITDIHSGYLFKKESRAASKKGFYTIQPKDLNQAGRIVWPTFQTPITTEPQPVHYLKKSDVLFLSKMNPRPVYVEADPEHSNTIASSHFFIIRTTSDKILPEYLFWFLNQHDTKKFIRSVAAGSSILNVKKSDLQELEIPLPPLAMQETISELARLSDRHKEIHQAIIEKTERLVEHVTLKALKKQVRN